MVYCNVPDSVGRFVGAGRASAGSPWRGNPPLREGFILECGVKPERRRGRKRRCADKKNAVRTANGLKGFLETFFPARKVGKTFPDAIPPSGAARIGALAVPSALLVTVRLGALGALVLVHLEASFLL